jgi:hypothetical protein
MDNLLTNITRNNANNYKAMNKKFRQTWAIFTDGGWGDYEPEEFYAKSDYTLAQVKQRAAEIEKTGTRTKIVSYRQSIRA